MSRASEVIEIRLSVRVPAAGVIQVAVDDAVLAGDGVKRSVTDGGGTGVSGPSRRPRFFDGGAHRTTNPVRANGRARKRNGVKPVTGTARKEQPGAVEQPRDSGGALELAERDPLVARQWTVQRWAAVLDQEDWRPAVAGGLLAASTAEKYRQAAR
ncbi:MAG: hypothetical protein GXP27_16340, partial [Planctomycetes bacterium]|nr:hypothetical protein [Planctomycetota bacterium]